MLISLNFSFEMCDQPWHYIDIAQQALIAELNAAKTLRFTNDDGTDISMDITDATFANSLVAKNVPGSEVFSAPRRDSVNGKIVAKGRFNPRDDRNAVIENLTMEFEQGRLVRWHADQGQEHFERAISIDEGAKFVGEIGIGTNPHLRRHVMNSLLVEKIGGSFHVALGGAYKYKEYMGTPVNVDNGNRSKLHWDITTLLYGKGGCMYIDDRKVMENGLFLNPTYDVFNRGWAAVPEAERPDYWKNHPSGDCRHCRRCRRLTQNPLFTALLKRVAPLTIIYSRAIRWVWSARFFRFCLESARDEGDYRQQQ